MALPEFEYIAFAQAKQKVEKAQELKDAGKLEAAFDVLCDAVESLISDTESEVDDLETKFHDIEGRI